MDTREQTCGRVGCGVVFAGRRKTYCSTKCQQVDYRERHPSLHKIQAEVMANSLAQKAEWDHKHKSE